MLIAYLRQRPLQLTTTLLTDRQLKYKQWRQMCKKVTPMLHRRPGCNRMTL